MRQNNRMPEHTLDSFTVFWFAFTHETLALYNALHIVVVLKYLRKVEEEQERRKNSRREIL